MMGRLVRPRQSCIHIFIYLFFCRRYELSIKWTTIERMMADGGCVGGSAATKEMNGPGAQ